MKRRRLLSIAIVLLSYCGPLLVSAEDTEQAAAAAKKKKATSGELFETIKRADAAVFEAFNARDLERLISMFTEDLEFYDDGSKGGGKSVQQRRRALPHQATSNRPSC